MQHSPTFGVYLFFLLSGFVMGGIVRSQRESASDFIANRFLRIYPPLWGAVALYYLLALAQAKAMPGLEPRTLTLWPLVERATQMYDIPIWTLHYELAFYLIVACFIVLKLPNWLVVVSLGVWAGIIVAVDIAFGQFYFHVLPGASLPISCLNLLFIGGMLMALLDIQLARINMVALIGLAISFWLIAVYVDAVPKRLPVLWLYIISLCLALLAFSRLRRIPALILNIGNASYGIYLVHFMVIDMVYLQLRKAGTITGFWSSLPIIAGVALMVAWAYGAAEFAAYKWMKKRMRAGITWPRRAWAGYFAAITDLNNSALPNRT
jgi:peptidoglycan/LPS O-acetylase OafA/YrhL